MVKIGPTVLLPLFLLLVTGVNSPSHAQEKLISLPEKATSTQPCTALSELLVVDDSCVYKSLSQKELVKKALASTPDEQSTTYSYAIEPTYYVAPTIATPTPTASTPQPTVAPAQTAAPKSMVPATGQQVDANVIFDLINSHRSSIGLPAFQKDEALCSLANTRSFELHDELFVNFNLHSGLYNRNLPYWITEDAKWGSNEAGTVQWWLNSPVHRRAIEGNYTYSCGACNGSQCAQLFTSYTPKGMPTAQTPISSQTMNAVANAKQ